MESNFTIIDATPFPDLSGELTAAVRINSTTNTVFIIRHINEITHTRIKACASTLTDTNSLHECLVHRITTPALRDIKLHTASNDKFYLEEIQQPASIARIKAQIRNQITQVQNNTLAVWYTKINKRWANKYTENLYHIYNTQSPGDETDLGPEISLIEAIKHNDPNAEKIFAATVQEQIAAMLYRRSFKLDTLEIKVKESLLQINPPLQEVVSESDLHTMIERYSQQFLLTLIEEGIIGILPSSK